MTMPWLSAHLLSAILLTPLAGVIVLLLVGKGRVGAVRWMAVACALANVAAALSLGYRFEPFGSAWQFVERAPTLSSIGPVYYLGVDGIAVLFVVATTLIGATAALSSWNVDPARIRTHYIGLLLLMTALIGTFVSLDGLMFFGFWGATVVSTHFVVGSRPGPASFAGGALTLSAIVTLAVFNHSATGVYSFDIPRFQQLTLQVAAQTWIFLALLGGLVLTLPLHALRAWLRDPPGQTPAAGFAIVAAIVLKVGAFGLVRFSLPMLPDASRQFAPAMVALAVAGMAWASALALVQSEWKRVLAYSTLAHLGMMTLGVFALTPAAVAGSIVHQINHAAFAAALMLLVALGSEHRASSIAAPRGMPAATPMFAAVLFLMTMASIGVPGSSGFVGEFLILQGVYAAHAGWAVAAAGASALAAAPLLVVYRRTAGGVGNSTGAAPIELSVRDAAALAPLAALVVWIGLYPTPVLRMVQSSVGRVIVRVNPAYGPAISQAEADCNKKSAPVEIPGLPAGLMTAPPCETPGTAAPAAPPQRDGR